MKEKQEKKWQGSMPPLTSSSHICPYSLEKCENYSHNLSWLWAVSSPSLPLTTSGQFCLAAPQRWPGSLYQALL